MKIKSIKTYQAIRFETRSETWFSLENKQKDYVKELSIEIQPHIHCVLVSSKKDSKLIPFANIAYMEPVSTTKSQPKTESTPKSKTVMPQSNVR